MFFGKIKASMVKDIPTIFTTVVLRNRDPFPDRKFLLGKLPDYKNPATGEHNNWFVLLRRFFPMKQTN
jgi:hypothetical protein